MNTDDRALADLKALQEWMREPDNAETFGTQRILEWINRRPTHVVPKVLAALQSPPPVVSGEAIAWRTLGTVLDMVDGLYREHGTELTQRETAIAQGARNRWLNRGAPVVEEGRREAIANALHLEARRLARAVVGSDDCPDAYDQSALNWVRNRQYQLADAAILALTPVEGVGESAAQRVVAAWRAVNTEFGSYFVDEDGPYREVRDMDEAIEALSTPATAQGDVREGIYVASRASIPERGRMWRDLRASGVQINSSWIDEDGEGETSDWSELWTRIEAEIKRSRALILYAEPNDFPLKGAFVEAGIAIAAGIPVFIVAPSVELGSYGCRPIGSWASHPLVSYADTIGGALATLGAPHEG
jgi:hypothetical protein